MRRVSPLGSTLVVIFCSKLLRSWDCEACAPAKAIAVTICARKYLENQRKVLLGIQSPCSRGGESHLMFSSKLFLSTEGVKPRLSHRHHGRSHYGHSSAFSAF